MKNFLKIMVGATLLLTTIPASANAFRVSGVFEGQMLGNNALGGAAYELTIFYNLSPTSFHESGPANPTTNYDTNASQNINFTMRIVGNTLYAGQIDETSSGNMLLTLTTISDSPDRMLTAFDPGGRVAFSMKMIGDASSFPGPFLPSVFPSNSAIGLRGVGGCFGDLGCGANGAIMGRHLSGIPVITSLGGPSANSVPEPGSWAMLIAGFGIVGAMARRRRGVAQVTA